MSSVLPARELALAREVSAHVLRLRRDRYDRNVPDSTTRWGDAEMRPSFGSPTSGAMIAPEPATQNQAASTENNVDAHGVRGSGEPGGSGGSRGSGESGRSGGSGEPIMTLRGAGVRADTRHVGFVVLALVLIGLAVVVAVLFVAGARKNDQITALQRHGLDVEVRVSRCTGLLGGSGSNAAGYACRGTYTVDGRSYNEAIPGDTLLAPGSKLRAVTTRNDPALITTASALAGEKSSERVFILPGALLAILLLASGMVILRARRSLSRSR
ncbi:MAG TPA: hypothetical protein VEJ87_16070 [Acidimicrobiales bacterium]|nr:hypothetical protein [Acidimicrobiales bacterium]